MRFARPTLSIFAIVGMAAVAAGCGGAAPAAPAGVTPAPDPNATGTVADTTAATNPDGTPVVAETTPSATVPTDLDGEDVGAFGASSSSSIFDALASTATQATGAPVDGGSDSTSTSTSATTTPTTSTSTTAAKTYNAAIMTVDGVTYQVSKQGTFPKEDPMFRLISISATSVQIDLIAGSFATGGQGLVLARGHKISLANSSESTTYRISFVQALEGAEGIDTSTSTDPASTTTDGETTDPDTQGTGGSDGASSGL